MENWLPKINIKNNNQAAVSLTIYNLIFIQTNKKIPPSTRNLLTRDCLYTKLIDLQHHKHHTPIPHHHIIRQLF